MDINMKAGTVSQIGIKYQPGPTRGNNLVRYLSSLVLTNTKIPPPLGEKCENGIEKEKMGERKMHVPLIRFGNHIPPREIFFPLS
jgi:hypothetical protein